MKNKILTILAAICVVFATACDPNDLKNIAGVPIGKKHTPKVVNSPRWTYPDLNASGNMDVMCQSPYNSDIVMPCALVLNISNDGKSALFLTSTMVPNSSWPTFAQACAEQPQYAAWYKCNG